MIDTPNSRRKVTTGEPMKIAIVHDALVVPGGAERFTIFLSQAFPEAPIYTSVYLSDKTHPEFKTKEIHTLPGASIVKNANLFKKLYPLWFIGFWLLDLSEYDLVISSSTYAAKFIKPLSTTIHVSYIHSPFRFLWKRDSYSSESLPFKGVIIKIIDFFIPIFKKIDKHFTNQIGYIITNSENMALFIKKVYHRDVQIIYPPIDINQYYLSSTKREYYLFVGRFVSHKRVDIAIQACVKSNRKLLIVGEGPEYNSLKKMASEHITFLGVVEDGDLKKLYSEARGLIFPGTDDFGLVPVEAQASGCPVIAFRSGGALETVIENKTGVFFNEQSVASLLDGLDKFESLSFDYQEIRQNAMRFDVTIFKKMIHDYILSKNKLDYFTKFN